MAMIEKADMVMDMYDADRDSGCARNFADVFDCRL
jgi:hypothetical protein